MKMDSNGEDGRCGQAHTTKVSLAGAGEAQSLSYLLYQRIQVEFPVPRWRLIPPIPEDLTLINTHAVKTPRHIE